MSAIGIVHISFGLLSLIFGSIVFLRRKGTQVHRAFGYIYVVSMLVLNITAMMIYKVFNGFGPFHVFALTSLAAIIVGFVPVYFKKPPERWLTNHYNWMCWSYVGLLAATSAEIALRLPPIQRLGAVGFALIFVFPIAVVFIGRYFLVRNREATIEDAKLNYKSGLS